MTDQNIKAFCLGLKDLMEKHGIHTIGGDIDGDTHGISERFVVVEKGGNLNVIAGYDAYIDRSDLQDYLED